MKFTKITNKILLLEFPSIKEMNLSLFRISEFSEGKQGIRYVYSSPDIFLDLYSDESGLLDYISYWEGHNIPKKTLILFNNTYWKQLSNRELAILSASNEITDDGYIIASVEGDKTTLIHEMSHALYADNLFYIQKQDELYNAIPKDIIEKLKNDLKAIDYIDDVLQDEIIAYCTAYDEEEWKEIFPDVDPAHIIEFIIGFYKNYLEFKPEINND